MADDEQSWVFDFVYSLFRTPAWEVPIMTWIDDNCLVFDGEEENKFSYTELHEVCDVTGLVFVVLLSTTT